MQSWDYMHEQLWKDLDSASFQVNSCYGDITVVSLADIDSILFKHNYLKLGDVLKIIAPTQTVALKAESTLFSFDFIGTAKSALEWGVRDAFKNISDSPFDMNVTKIDIITGSSRFTDINGNIVDEPSILIFIK